MLTDDQIKTSKFNQLLKNYQTSPSTKKNNRVFDDTLQFPCVFKLKVIGVNDEEGLFVNDVIVRVASILGCLPENVNYSIKDSNADGRGKYISITLSPKFQNADELYEVYDIGANDPRVKFVI